jgi:predicted DNA-binding transcriptional regulator AlpA
MARQDVTGHGLIEKLAFSIQEFCTLHGISRSHYYNMRKLGLGPQEMELRGRKSISFEAAAAWRREREDASTSEADA